MIETDVCWILRFQNCNWDIWLPCPMLVVDQLYIPHSVILLHIASHVFLQIHRLSINLTNFTNSGTKPMCTSNTSLTRVLVENDCDLEPDHVELNCSVAYRGNIPPLLEWHHSSKSDVEMERYVVNRRNSTDNSVAMHFMTVKLDWKFNGSNFVCALKDVNERKGCATENISVVCEYAFNIGHASCTQYKHIVTVELYTLLGLLADWILLFLYKSLFR